MEALSSAEFCKRTGWAVNEHAGAFCEKANLPWARSFKIDRDADTHHSLSGTLAVLLFDGYGGQIFVDITGEEIFESSAKPKLIEAWRKGHGLAGTQETHSAYVFSPEDASSLEDLIYFTTLFVRNADIVRDGVVVHISHDEYFMVYVDEKAFDPKPLWDAIKFLGLKELLDGEKFWTSGHSIE